MVAGALLRRDDLHSQLRQDRAGDADGRGAREHPDDLRLRRADGGGRRSRRAEGRPDHRLRRRRRARSGKIDDARLEELEIAGCPTCGSCCGMFTANSMNCLCEALGIALPGNGTILARIAEAARAGARPPRTVLMSLLERGIRFRDIVTADAIDNAVALDVAMGGSTNTLLHVIAVAHEAGVEYPLARFNEVAERVPHLAKVSPGVGRRSAVAHPGCRCRRRRAGAAQGAGAKARDSVPRCAHRHRKDGRARISKACAISTSNASARSTSRTRRAEHSACCSAISLPTAR